MPGIRDKLDQYDRTIGRKAPGRSQYSSPAFAAEQLSKLGCGYRCLRLGLIGQTSLIITAGVIVCAVGAYLNNDAALSAVIGTGFITGVLIMGSFLLVTGAVGLAGAMNQSRIVLIAFVCTMVCVLLTLIALGSWAVSKKGREATIAGALWQHFDNSERNAVQDYYDLLCCGGNFPTQYPGSNCPVDSKGVPIPAFGCVSFMVPDIRKAYEGFGVAAIVLGVFFLVSAVNGCCLNYGIQHADEEHLRRQKEERQTRGRV